MNATDKIWTDLRNAVWQRQFGTAEKLLKEHPELVSLGTHHMKETVLHYLAVENDQQGVEWLHKHGFDINTCNVSGTPVVFEVAQLKYKELLLWFIRNGVDLMVHDPMDGNIFSYLEIHRKPKMIEFIRENIPKAQYETLIKEKTNALSPANWE